MENNENKKPNDGKKKFVKREFNMSDFVFLSEPRILAKRGDNWNLELNRMKWSKEGEERYDIRAWRSDHSRLGGGISINKNEAKALRSALNECTELDDE